MVKLKLSRKADEPIKTFSVATTSVKHRSEGTADVAREAMSDAPEVPSDAPADTASARKGRWRWVVIAVLVAALAAAVFAWVQERGDAADLRHLDSLSAEADKAAREYVIDLTTYDHTSIDEQQATLAAESTEKFQSTFADSMKSLEPIFTELEASAQGTVLDAAVRDVSDEQAVVLVFADQKASSNKTDKPQDQASRLRVHLVRSDDRWLLDEVELM